jgi:hypothetical protein
MPLFHALRMDPSGSATIVRWRVSGPHIRAEFETSVTAGPRAVLPRQEPHVHVHG